MTLRIASLVPSVTELVVALGLAERLVARTGFCIHPRQALLSVPKVGGTKDANLAKLRRLAPTHVIVNVDENRLDTVDALRQFVPSLIVTHPCAPEDNLSLIDQLAAAFDAEPGVRERAAALRAAFAFELASTRPEDFAPCEVLYLIWHQPWMTVARDTYISRLLARVNWHSWPARGGGDHGAARYPALDGSEPGLGAVRRVLLSSEPFRFGAEHLAAAQALCPQARVQAVDGELLSWYGPRALDGLRYLRQLAAG
ncbi:MAG: helical backbone metal receptor [Rubrivivax sp.]|nr:helical backbone metal receptor [Rubrivivax sp.]